MKRNFSFYLLLLPACLLLSTQKCKQENIISPSPKYEFVEKLTLTPYKKVYAINDTIWIQFQALNKQLYDKISNSNILMDTSSLSALFYYHKRYIVGTQPEYFCEISPNNTTLNPSFTITSNWVNTLNFTTDCNTAPFSIRVGFIPKKVGIYSLEPWIKVQDCPNKKIRSYYTSKFVFDLADCNKDIWFSIPEQSRRSTDPNVVPNLIDKKEIFIFKVE